MLNIQGFDCSATSSLQWKVPYLEEYVSHADVWFAIISITETWVKPSLSEAQLSITGYNLYRSDRIERERGGCCLYIHEALPVSNDSKFDNDYCEVIVCIIDSAKVLVFSVYRPGKTPHEKFNEALEFIYKFLNEKDDSWTVFITGDFNFPNICWDTLTIKPDSHGCTTCAEAFLQLVESNLLSQVIDKTTRTDSSSTANILDIVLTNKEAESIKEIEVTPTSLSDHDLVSIVISDVFKNPHSEENSCNRRNYSELSLDHFNSYNFHKADFDKINNELQNIDWDLIKANCTDQAFPEIFYDTVQSICAKHTPLKKSYKKQKSKYHQACYSINRKRQKVKTRIKALQRLNPTSNRINTLQLQLIQLEKEAKEKILHCRQLEEKKAIDAIKSNPNYFYSYAKQKNSSKSRIGPLRCNQSSSFVDDPQAMADILQNQFISFFSDPQNSQINTTLGGT